MNTNIRWLAAYTADIFDDYLAEIKLPIVCSDASEEEEVCMTAYDEDAVKTLSRGQFFYGSSYMRKGQPSQCHANSAYLWDANRGHCSIATGYALSEDGLWRCHSWVVQPRSRTMRVWEMTVKRVVYFGFVMNDTECQEFLDNNT